ncbi:MAG TPA: GNAT family N-acetyltransferase [Acidimicrobiia bacterium]|jgi:ribosomal protein S18 acetylase RimI-like enzyme|nr:GNAT family N-acetyltransferase [Acidimicrobiia bacterium]
MDSLDNPVWHALTGRQAHLSEGTDLALRYDPEVAVFAGMPDAPGPDAWKSLGTLLGSGGVAGVFQGGTKLAPPADLDVLFALPGLQMVATTALGEPDPAFVPLTVDDVPDMLALVERTRPGPFFGRTIEMGTYLGVRDEGRLVAMTGVRIQWDGYTEISAVCTDEDHRNRGLAARLVRAVAHEIETRGEVPILHVASENANAIALYEKLGFATRTEVEFTIVQVPT